ncbi:baseplate assembly protein [Clostridia bacterium]|nr:baseplate assembly protein [Clostridia bacterium]
MYEQITYEELLKRMLAKVVELYPDVDTREGSIIYTALAPAAVELKNMYIWLDVVLNETFADTASRLYLIRRAAERGVNVESATYAIRQGEFNMDVPIGSRFSLNKLNYIVTDKISTGIFKLRCEMAGSIGNSEFGVLIPIEYIEGLTTAALTAILIPGDDEEETEHLRQRYFDSLESQAFGGNIADYKEKVRALDGVGGVKVYPIWNGSGTVKLVIVDSTYSKPSDILVDAVQTTIDPTQNQGEGLGIAPIGHVVTVIGVEETVINITTTLTYVPGWDWDKVKDSVYMAVDSYLLELSKSWEAEEYLVVRISQIDNRILDLDGILDITDTKINGQESNVVLEPDNIPIRGTVVDDG